MFLHLCRKVQLPVLLTAILLIFVSIPVSAQNNCGGNRNHDASWNGWDNLISRLQSRGCDYVDITVDVFAIPSVIDYPTRTTFDYVIVVRNIGNITAHNFNIHNVIPAEFNYTSATVNFYGGQLADISGCFPSAGIIDCAVVSMLPGAQLSIELSMEINLPRTATSTVSMTVDPDEGDLDPRNNTSSITIVIE